MAIHTAAKLQLISFVPHSVNSSTCAAATAAGSAASGSAADYDHYVALPTAAAAAVAAAAAAGPSLVVVEAVQHVDHKVAGANGRRVAVQREQHLREAGADVHKQEHTGSEWK
mgnify:CR=1 FL=1